MHREHRFRGILTHTLQSNCVVSPDGNPRKENANA